MEESTQKSSPWRAIIRSEQSGDVIFTGWHSCLQKTETDEEEDLCQTKFKAERWSWDDQVDEGDNMIMGTMVGDECVCQCPLKLPTFVQNQDQENAASDVEGCVEKLEFCPKPVLFKSQNGDTNATPTVMPVASQNGLLSDGYILNPIEWKPMWKESTIKVRPKVGIRCEPKGLLFLSGKSSEWKEGDLSMIRFGWTDGDANIFWNLSKVDESVKEELKGAIVRMDLDCQRGSHMHVHCMAFKIDGQIGRHIESFQLC
ncbi:hypothetical protein Ddc_13241 [Ditylenchus destructor]|nr:hypothetical protein Ddc_13241 [Ditylenchus destructor]